jgi:hypothetical protein
MTGDGGFLVEDFLDAVTAQLDRTQDALAAKARVRPLMFALRTFSIDLQVFVSMDASGNVRLRSSAPGEVGASTLKVDFTTITRPMVEENTVSLAMAQAPTLGEAGLKPAEEQALRRVGVQNVAQLQALRASGAGVDGISRMTSGLVPADRLRAALRLGRPMVANVVPLPAAGPAPAPGPAAPETPAIPPEIVRIPHDTRLLRFNGSNLLAGPATPVVRLDGRPLKHARAGDDGLEVHLPDGVRGGALELDFGEDDEPVRYELRVEHEGNGHVADPWAPEAAR